MGIYDREYVRVGPRSQSGLGSLRFISINVWIIIINFAVFVVDQGLQGHRIPAPVAMQLSDLGRQVAFRNRAAEPVLRDSLGRRIAPDSPELDPRNPTPPRIYQVLYDKTTRQQIGSQEVELMTPLQAYGHFSTALGFFQIELWRFITFQFLHANFTHVLFNMFGLWIFGGMVEQYLGSKRYLAFYLTCGIFGAVSYLLLNFLGNVIPSQHRIPLVLPDSIYTPLVGASAGVFGVIMACAFIAPNAMVMLILPPVPLKLKWLAYGYVVVAAWNLLRGGQNAGGDAAHIGGAIAGAFFIRQAHLLRDFFEVLGPGKGAGGRGRRAASEAEVDRILSKVASQGLRSLTEEEKRTLRRASEAGRR